MFSSKVGLNIQFQSKTETCDRLKATSHKLLISLDIALKPIHISIYQLYYACQLVGILISQLNTKYAKYVILNANNVVLFPLIAQYVNLQLPWFSSIV